MERRIFVKRAALGSLAGILGAEIVFGAHMPDNYDLLGLQDPDPFKMFGKDRDMMVLNTKPWNMEAVAHQLDDRITPNPYIFVRNNGQVPEDINEKEWTLTIDGESVKEPKTFSLEALKTQFSHHTYQLTLECGGNGRKEFNPPAKGNQWDVGAVYCASWTGVRLRDILEAVGIKKDAIYIGYHAIDRHLSGDPTKEVISRGVPVSKAMQDETLLAFKMNGKDIPLVHGFPLRLVCGGWPASTSGKWVNRISVRNIVHDGPKMTGSSYKMPRYPVAPGEEVKDEDMDIIESMPVKSLITYPRSGAMINSGKKLNIRGHAWAGELEVSKVYYSIDFGTTWSDCVLEKPANRLAWQHFRASINFPGPGYYEVWARAVDAKGIS
ncbi:MAG TPA: sulfite oxidase, partial [Arenibacter sp.]|nr:sulfite oxidase [Arenibacter sp.]